MLSPYEIIEKIKPYVIGKPISELTPNIKIDGIKISKDLGSRLAVYNSHYEIVRSLIGYLKENPIQLDYDVLSSIL